MTRTRSTGNKNRNDHCGDLHGYVLLLRVVTACRVHSAEREMYNYDRGMGGGGVSGTCGGIGRTCVTAQREKRKSEQRDS
jgi:hypothetical protein